MPVTLDLSSDYELFDNTEPVDVVLKSLGGTAAENTVRVENALRRELSKREQESLGGLLNNRSVVWEIPVEQLGDSVEIQEGDVILELEPDAPLRWTVVSTQLATLKTRWRCICNKQRVA